MPFYALKRYKKPIQDKRRQANGEPLRRSWHQAFLSPSTPNSSRSSRANRNPNVCIHEAQISVMVTGTDERSWYGLAFVDTYYHGDHNPEGVADLAARFQPANEGRARMLLDPIALNELNADIPFWNPREWFLRILEIRVRQVLSEWQDVVECILQRTEPYFHPPASIYPADSVTSDDPERHAVFRGIQQSVNQTTTFMDNVIALINKTIDAWTTFQKSDAVHFSSLTTGPGRAGSPQMLLRRIDGHIRNLGVMCREVEAQRQRLKTLVQQGSTDLQQDTVNIAVNSQQTGEWMMLLTIVTVVSAES
ncbi:hypothetical protein B0T16DRAFT_457191 [Cercophora newfieldiana]|uniref:Uncharacterized protein n=1 Tax=Cercophora newfieldiana TaxID=92897 RepID=A0AA39YBY2_9PEZI|nr:hypothetical protein B0T16DRAFT_457191 [Cercophora newfieldiana]